MNLSGFADGVTEPRFKKLLQLYDQLHKLVVEMKDHYSCVLLFGSCLAFFILTK